METPDRISTNFDATMRTWGKLDLGTLVMKPEYKDKGIEDILDDAGLGFPIALRQSYYNDPVSGNWMPSRGHVVIRLDNSQELGFGMTDGYNAMSYPQIMQDYFQDLTVLGGVPTRAISFRGGAKAAIQFLFGDDWYVGDRVHKSFLNFYASHDGKTSIEFNSSDVCIVCGNTHAASKADGTLKFSIRHTASASRRLLELRDNVMNMQKFYTGYYELLNTANRMSASTEVQKQFITAMFPDPKKEVKNKSLENQRAQLGQSIAISVAETNKPADKVTIYDLFAGVTRYTSYKTQKRNPDEQVEYVTSGPGAELNSTGFSWLKQYTEENSPVLQVSMA